MTCREKTRSAAGAALRLLTLSLLGTVILVAKASTVSTGDDKFTPRLTVRLYGGFSLSAGLLDASEKEADQILRDLPFRLHWVNCTSQLVASACISDLVPTDLVVRVLNKALPQASTDALGIACSKRGEAVAYIFYDRMIALRTQRRSLPSIMGRVLAHEIVHVLLPDAGHSEFGLMRGHWGTDDLATGSSTWMGLPPASVRLMDKEALRRVKLRDRRSH